ncbi:sensor histidine kinase [Paenibacillus sp. GCM10023248]|uniref:sensor histidine kinase n=1 Tax=Bacillales TaxID=1385 RepID=UPI0023793675|nr:MULTISPECIES: sensor histidine kinase [Bacillales]MDD9265557.1 sensor histidine kinase [Paenibacillus sp. MAHUQ-63]MDR6878792.1 two-component system sensor histidine kinase YesM [Bacillus sp. 3255]
MGFGKLGITHLRNNLFMKLLLLFSLITILTIISFSYFMYRSMSQAAINRELDIQKKAMTNVNNYLGQKYDSAQSILFGLYRDSSLAAGVSFMLQHPFQEYVQHSLEQYNMGGTSTWNDGLDYFKNRLEDDADIRNLMLYSVDQQVLYVLSHNRPMRMISANAAHSYIPDVMALDNKSVSLPNVWLRDAANQWDNHLYSVRTPISDKQTLKNIGQQVVFFSSDGIWNVLSNEQAELKGTILVLSSDGGVLFDSSDRYYGKPYPHMDQVNAMYEHNDLSKTDYVTKLTQNKGDFIVVGLMPKEELAASSWRIGSTIFSIGAVCIVIAILLPSLVVLNVAKRTNLIIRFTRKVKQGDLTARIQDNREDELGQISRSFNEMIDELNQYIDRVYKAEIKQKHTELTALQARVNPHFLYNTLEVIRMRAISQGAHDVGEMIYSLSALFRSFVQQKRNYTLKDELEACRLYLELFQIRYKDKFTYSIACDPRLASRRVMKMSLQPIIENYIVHGLRSESTDNELHIRVRLEEPFLHVQVEDNGNGISPERLKEIGMLLQSEETEGESFGLRSINQRLKLLYGGKFGIEVHSEAGRGTCIDVWLPADDGKEGHDV